MGAVKNDSLGQMRTSAAHKLSDRWADIDNHQAL